MSQTAIITRYPGMWAVESTTDHVAAGRRFRSSAVRLAHRLMPGAPVAFAHIVESSDGHEYKIIMADESPARVSLARRIEAAIDTDTPLAAEPLAVDELGQSAIVPALATDRFGDLRALTAEDGLTLIVNLGSDDQGTIAISSFLAGRQPGSVSPEKLGLTDDSTFQDVLWSVIANDASKLRTGVQIEV